MVDPATRNVSLQATLDNPGPRVAPGNVRASRRCCCRKKNPTLFIPATAVSYAPFGDSVFVIEKKNDEKTEQGIADACASNSFALGETRGDFVAVTEGLKAGETDRQHGRLQVAQRHERRRSITSSRRNRRLAPEAEPTVESTIRSMKNFYRSLYPPAGPRAGR